MNRILTITGPSGSGKTELVKLLTQRHNFSKLVSVTTRPPRHGEVEGLDYYFISNDDFLSLKKGNRLIQEVEFNGKYYGTTRDELLRVYGMGRVPVVIVEPTGILQFRHVSLQENLLLKTVYIYASYEKLVERFLERVVDEKDKQKLAYHARRITAINDELKWATTWPFDLRLDNDSDNLNVLVEYARVIGENYGGKGGDGEK